MHLNHTLAAKPEPLNGATRIASLHLVRISSSSHRLALSFTHIVRSVYFNRRRRSSSFRFQSLSNALGVQPGASSDWQDSNLRSSTSKVDGMTKLPYSLKPGIIYTPPVGWRPLVQKPRTTSADSILTTSIFFVKSVFYCLYIRQINILR